MSVKKLCVTLISIICLSYSYAQDFCENDGDGGQSCEHNRSLHRLSPTKVGETEEIVMDGISYSLKTLSMRPALFEVENFLTDEECAHMIGLAEAEGLEESVTRKHDDSSGGVKVRDLNGDKQLSIDEMILTIEDNFDIYPTDEDVLQLYKDLKIDKNSDKLITPDELGTIDIKQLTHYLADFSRRKPAKRSRHSRQTWIYPDRSTDDIFRSIQNRVQQLTKLDPILITKSDFQVVNYGVEGHYNAHHDSSRVHTEAPCCTRSRTSACRICRFATILMYLNDVEEGGETAFPVADNATLDSAQFISEHRMNLMRYCPDANVKVVPAKRKVVLWYNHLVDPTTGWLGEMDEFTWHGGCPVTKGNKWIGNFWIKVTDDIDESFNPYH